MIATYNSTESYHIKKTKLSRKKNKRGVLLLYLDTDFFIFSIKVCNDEITRELRNTETDLCGSLLRTTCGHKCFSLRDAKLWNGLDTIYIGNIESIVTSNDIGTYAADIGVESIWNGIIFDIVFLLFLFALFLLCILC